MLLVSIKRLDDSDGKMCLAYANASCKQQSLTLNGILFHEFPGM